jgi:hypothetical protein
MAGKTARKLNNRSPIKEFPQFFPQVWKTLGRDQRRMREQLMSGWLEAGNEAADCSTVERSLTLLEGVF